MPRRLRSSRCSDDDTRRLIANLLGGGSLPDPVQKRIAGLAEGNALFTEELLAMLVDEKRLVREDERWVVAGDLGDLRIPQEISAFLAARLERLPEGERTLLVRGSVEGAALPLRRAPRAVARAVGVRLFTAISPRSSAAT